MSLKLYAHPFSSYCQKVLIALYENATAFEMRLLAPDDPQAAAELAALIGQSNCKAGRRKRKSHRNLRGRCAAWRDCRALRYVSC